MSCASPGAEPPPSSCCRPNHLSTAARPSLLIAPPFRRGLLVLSSHVDPRWLHGGEQPRGPHGAIHPPCFSVPAGQLSRPGVGGSHAAARGWETPPPAKPRLLTPWRQNIYGRPRNIRFGHKTRARNLTHIRVRASEYTGVSHLHQELWAKRCCDERFWQLSSQPRPASPPMRRMSLSRRASQHTSAPSPARPAPRSPRAQLDLA